MLLYSPLLCKKIAGAPGGHKKFMLSKLGGGGGETEEIQKLNQILNVQSKTTVFCWSHIKILMFNSVLKTNNAVIQQTSVATRHGLFSAQTSGSVKIAVSNQFYMRKICWCSSNRS